MAFNILLVWKKLPSLRLSGFYMLPPSIFLRVPTAKLALRYNFSYN
jgi:hypothetical protein